MVDFRERSSFAMVGVPCRRLSSQHYLLQVLSGYVIEMQRLRKKLQSVSPGGKTENRQQHFRRLQTRCAPFLVDLLIREHHVELSPMLVASLDDLGVVWPKKR